LLVEVWDSGIGIAGDQLQTIFEEFHQIGQAPEDSNRGLGLGLSIVQRLGHLLGHGVRVRSLPGKGSVFTIDLPHQRMPPADGLPPPAARLPDLARPLHVLVVEDEPDVLDLLNNCCAGRATPSRTRPMRPVPCALWPKGVAAPMLLTDYNLPGHQWAGSDHGLRASVGGVLPAIMLSGDISTDTLSRIAKGDCALLTKPVHADDLMQPSSGRAPVRTPAFGNRSNRRA
jgi:two-component system CheB/CheR fusion protein